MMCLQGVDIPSTLSFFDQLTQKLLLENQDTHKHGNMERGHEWLNIRMFTPVKGTSGTISIHFFTMFYDVGRLWQHKVSLVLFDRNNTVKTKKN